MVEENVLLTQVTRLHRNLERVQKLLTQDLERIYDPLIKDLERVEQYLKRSQEVGHEDSLEALNRVMQKLHAANWVLSHRKVSGKFLRVINPSKSRLEKLKTCVESEGRTRVQLKQAWKDYLSHKQKVQQAFSQCLEYIGGIAIRAWELEENTCDLAANLVDQYVDLGISWGSVTIMAEKRRFDDVAQKTQIIRLRFPDWDIWSLPFTAYEFGRWMAGEDSELVEGLKKFYTDEKERILRLIITRDDTALLASGDVTEEEIKDLAPEIKGWRQDYQAGTKTAEESGRFVDRQGIYMSELFADAFATYFLGPAYPYAQVCLHIDPTEVLLDHSCELLPARRMDFMLRLLKEMNDLAKAKKGDFHASGPYQPECKRLKWLWENVCKVMQPDYKAEFHCLVFYGIAASIRAPDAHRIRSGVIYRRLTQPRESSARSPPPNEP